MKKEILAAAAVSGSLLMISGAWAQTCVTPPSCEELGYTKSASDCEGMESLLCPFDKSKYYCVDVAGSLANATPGSILYSDGTVSWDVISGKTAVGIVAYVAGSTRFAVALENSGYKSWSYNNEDITCLDNLAGETITDFNGASNTACLVNYGGSFPAAEACNSYKPVSSGMGSSGWYLPAAGELYTLGFNEDAINLGLKKLSKSLISGLYWSSTEINIENADVIKPNATSYSSEDRLKYKSHLVRCFIAF